MSYDFTGKYVSESYYRLIVNDQNIITDATGSDIIALNLPGGLNSEGIGIRNFIREVPFTFIYDNTASFTATSDATVELYDHNESYKGPAGALFVSGGNLYFASQDHTEGLEKTKLPPTNNVIYITVSSSEYTETITSPATLNYIRYTDVYCNPPLKGDQKIIAYISYSLHIDATRNVSDVSKAGASTASLQVNPNYGPSFSASLTYNFNTSSFTDNVPVGTNFYISSSGVFTIELRSGSRQFITASVFGYKSSLTSNAGVRMWVVSGSIVKPTETQISSLTTQSFYVDVSSSFDQNKNARYLLEVQPYEMTSFITGSNTPLSHYPNTSITLSTNKEYYWEFDEVDYELLTLNINSINPTPTRTDTLVAGDNKILVTYIKNEKPFRNTGMNLENIDVTA